MSSVDPPTDHFGWARCRSPCRASGPVWQPLERLLAERFPKIEALYIDSMQHPDFSAQQGVHSPPVVRVYFNGQWHVERPYQMLFAPDD